MNEITLGPWTTKELCWCIAIFMALGNLIGLFGGIEIVKYRAVSAGVAEYVIDSKTGETQFRFKEVAK